LRQIKPYKLHAGQQTIFNELIGSRRALLRCGRRFGKTTLLETLAAVYAAGGSDGSGEVGHKVGWFAPDYKLQRPSFSRLRRMLGPMTAHASATMNIIELINGGLIEFWTLDNPDAGRSRDYDHVIIDEASLHKAGLEEIVEQAITPTLLDRGGTITMAGTPKGIDTENFFYMAGTQARFGYRQWHAPSWLNPNLKAEEVARLETDNPPLVYQQEFCAEFVDWSGAAFFSIDNLTVNGKPVPLPSHCDAIVATIDTATKTGKEHDGTAVVWGAYTKWPEPRLVILDWDIVQIEGSLLEAWLPSVVTIGKAYAKQCGARFGFLGAMIEDKASGMILLQQAARRNLPAQAIDSKITSLGKEERAISVSGYVWKGWIKLSERAFLKEVNYKGDQANHFRRQVIGFRVGNKEQIEDDLLDGFCYNIAVTLGNAEGF
jgi:hypothetical protein